MRWLEETLSTKSRTASKLIDTAVLGFNLHAGAPTIAANGIIISFFAKSGSNVALSDATDIRLPEATTDNAGLQVKVVFALAPAENVNIGFVTTNIVGGWVGTSDATEGVAASFVGFSVVGDGYKRAELDKDGEVAKAGGEAGTILEFFYTGVANVAIYRGHLIADVDSATGTTHLVTTTIIA